MICWWSFITISQMVYSPGRFKVTKRNSIRMICWWSFITISQMVYSPGRFKVTKRNSKIGKVVRGSTNLWYSVCTGAHILNCRKLDFRFRNINFAGTFRFRRVFDRTSHSYQDLEAFRFWTISPSYNRLCNTTPPKLTLHLMICEVLLDLIAPLHWTSFSGWHKA